MSSNEDVVVVSHLTKRYGDFTAVQDLSFSVGRGRILGFIGPNGAGKTTTIQVLVGMSRPTEGSASIAGVDCSSETQRIKELVGYMPDVFGSYDNMRVHEYLDFFGAAHRIPRRARRRRIDEVLEITNAGWMSDRYVEALSHGMKQRIAIARVMLHDPEVLILDEPANGLDPQARIEMREILLRLADSGKTLIVTSHILPELARICHSVAIITSGRLRAYGSVDEIMSQISQQRTIEILLQTGHSLTETAEVVRRLMGDCELSSSETESMVRFRTDRPEHDLCTLLKELVDAGIPVTQFREVAADLEDAFLSVTAAHSA